MLLTAIRTYWRRIAIGAVALMAIAYYATRPPTDPIDSAYEAGWRAGHSAGFIMGLAKHPSFIDEVFTEYETTDRGYDTFHWSHLGNAVARLGEADYRLGTDTPTWLAAYQRGFRAGMADGVEFVREQERLRAKLKAEQMK